MKLHIFTFNPFAENTYIISDDTSCVIIDPGCYDASEFKVLTEYIQANKLTPTKVVLTHAHLDHIFGLQRCLDHFDIPYFMHNDEKVVLDATPAVSSMYHVHCDPVTKEHKPLKEGESISMGGMEWSVLFTPGHSPGSISFYQKETGQLIAGDVLFHDSIGRTDLPGGNHDLLIRMIKEKLLTLPDETIVYPGHGPSTKIGYERANNPFLR